MAFIFQNELGFVGQAALMKHFKILFEQFVASLNLQS